MSVCSSPVNPASMVKQLHANRRFDSRVLVSAVKGKPTPGGVPGGGSVLILKSWTILAAIPVTMKACT